MAEVAEVALKDEETRDARGGGLMTDLTLTADEVTILRDALTDEMARACAGLGEELREHNGGSPVGLADSRDDMARLSTVGQLLDKLDPPGWREPIPAREEA